MAPIDEMTLRRLYHDERLSIREIAKVSGLNSRTIYDALVHWRIPRRSPGQRTTPVELTFTFDETALRHLYMDVGLTIQEIAIELHVKPWQVRTAMEYWRIPRRRRGPRSTSHQ